MDIDQFFKNSHYKINRILLSITGIWPFDTKIKRHVIHVALIMLLGSGFIFQIMGTIDVWQDLFKLADSLTMICLVVAAAFKRICALYMVPKIKIMLIKMQEYNLSQKSNKEYEIYKSHHHIWTKTGHCLFLVCTRLPTFLFHHVILYITRIIHIKSNKNDTSLNAQIGIVYRVNYMVDFSTYYPVIYMHTSLCLCAHIFMTLALDCLSIAMVEHCRGLFAVLSYRLENVLSENDYDCSTKTFRKDKFYLNVIYSFQKHGETIELIDMINSIYSPPLLLQMGLATIVLGILEYQVATSSENTRILQQISFLNGLLLNVFFENWRGQKIIDSSEKVFDAAYNAEWYNMPVACRKLLLLIMMKSIKPLVLTAGKFMVLSYVTYNTIIRTSFSYYMLLRSM